MHELARIIHNLEIEPEDEEEKEEERHSSVLPESAVGGVSNLDRVFNSLEGNMNIKKVIQDKFKGIKYSPTKILLYLEPNKGPTSLPIELHQGQEVFILRVLTELRKENFGHSDNVLQQILEIALLNARINYKKKMGYLNYIFSSDDLSGYIIGKPINPPFQNGLFHYNPPDNSFGDGDDDSGDMEGGMIPDDNEVYNLSLIHI